jgi:putative GTP pyrophosphokinase
MKSLDQPHDAVELAYRHRYDTVLVRLAEALDRYIIDCLKGEPRIDRIGARAKAVDRFVRKAGTLVDGTPKYTEPLSQIQDQIGARIVVFYKSDVDRIVQRVNRYFRAIESQQIVPDSHAEFKYFGHHLILVLPSDIVEEGMDETLIPAFFELQIKTLFQHAWSEADHDLAYKPGEIPLTSEQKRLVAFTSAQAWGADHIFDELFRERVT